MRALRAKIGQLTMENDFSEHGRQRIHRAIKKEIVERVHLQPIFRRCVLLDLPRSRFYHISEAATDDDLETTRLIDQCDFKPPYYSIRHIRDWLQHRGLKVNRKRTQRFMRAIGLVALYPKRDFSKANQAHKVYPCLLRSLLIDRPNQVSASDITYIPMSRGFVYLVVIMNWYWGRVLAWRVSNCNTLEASFCMEAPHETIDTYGAPEIFTSDQGSQFTSEVFTGTLSAHDIRFGMDGKCRWADHLFVEWLWRIVEYEEVYLNAYDSIADARA